MHFGVYLQNLVFREYLVNYTMKIEGFGEIDGHNMRAA